MSEPVVRIRNLCLALPKGADRPHAVEDLSLDLLPGKILCVVGESGSGKSMSAYALTGLLPRVLRVAGGRIEFEGRDLLALDERGWRQLRGRRIAMIFQEPMTALNPVMRIGDQIAEMFEAHDLLTPAERRARAVELAREVGLPEPEQIVRAYPHQLSGGQRQRAMIAMALALEPSVLVADEPTTALDVTTQAQILKLIRELQQRLGFTAVYVTHDQEEALAVSDQIIVMQDGVIAQQGSPRELYEAPASSFIADFIGEANVVPCEVLRSDGGNAIIRVGTLEHAVPGRNARPGPAKLAVRPNAITLEAGGNGAFAGSIRHAAYLGDHVEYEVETASGTLFVVDPAVDRNLPPATSVSIGFHHRGIAIINN